MPAYDVLKLDVVAERDGLGKGDELQMDAVLVHVWQESDQQKGGSAQGHGLKKVVALGQDCDLEQRIGALHDLLMHC